MTVPSYTEEDVELALAERRRHVFRDTRECVCGYGAVDGNDWNDHVMRAILAALSSAGRLVPPGSEVREEWGTRRWYRDEAEGFVEYTEFNEHAARRIIETRISARTELMHRTVLTTPWSVPDTEEGS